MLVLSRKESEQILIGKDVVVTVSRIHGNRVQLAIHAPRSIHIARAELKPFDQALPTMVEIGQYELAADDCTRDNPELLATCQAAASP